jgi:hypothetical protein
MANRNFYPSGGSLSREVKKLYGKVTIGASGAISAQDCLGFTVAKTAGETGRYTVTLNDKYFAFRGCLVTIEGVADAALTVLYAGVRNVAVSTTKTFDIQCVGAIATDTNPASTNVLHIEITLQNAADV